MNYPRHVVSWMKQTWLAHLKNQNLLVTLQLSCRGHGEKAVGSGVVDQWSWEQETR